VKVVMIRFAKGDATAPIGDDPKIIAHCCNDLGRWGAGFVLALSKKWPQTRELYLSWYRGNPLLLTEEVPGVEVTGRMGLGESKLIKVAPDLWIANIIGQHGIGVGSGGRPPVRYDALKKGLQATSRWATIHKASVHMPRIGAGLAGGSWQTIEVFVKNEIVNRGIEVTVYDL
jgi:O-acetyl-ADP-ribose deacetylase (regulator of RNase III)